jgi:hypothetical protein
MNKGNRVQRAYVAGHDPEALRFAVGALCALGYEVTSALDSPEYSTARDVAELLSFAAEDSAAIKLADVLVILPGYERGWELDEANLYGTPVVTLASLLGW